MSTSSSRLEPMGKGGDPLEPPKGLEAFSETGERIEGGSGRLRLTVRSPSSAPKTWSRW